MVPFNKLFIIALPRCATVSVTEAVGILGIRVAHLGWIAGEPHDRHYDADRIVRISQQIDAGDFNLDILQQCRGLSDYPACCIQAIVQFDRLFPGSRFINVRREGSLTRWLQSVEMQFVGSDLLAEDNGSKHSHFMNAIKKFRQMTFGSQQFDAGQYLDAYRNYQAWVAEYFAGRDDFLEFADTSLLATEGFERLCTFLALDHIPQVGFPSSDTHSQMPRQAFLAGLSSGRIQSQTGIRIER